jgi:endonuclease YncB( thermonuclease family)
MVPSFLAFSISVRRSSCGIKGENWPQVHLPLNLEEEARTARRGLWPMPNAMPPWEFTRQGRK